MDETVDRGRLSRRLMRSQGHAVLATSLADGASARPYASLVAVACDLDASLLLLISDLAQHSRNIAADARVSLLFDGGPHPSGPDPLTDPLAAPRLTVIGTAARCDDERLRARFVAHHPAAAQYAGFADFHLYRIAVERGHLVAGFGRISWVEGAELRLAGDMGALAEAEAEIVAHHNRGDADRPKLFATQLLRRPRGDWRMTGFDPEGIDLRAGEATARLNFGDSVAPVTELEEMQRRLVAMAAGAVAQTRLTVHFAPPE